jgi:hypothetical protein
MDIVQFGRANSTLLIAAMGERLTAAERAQIGARVRLRFFLSRLEAQLLY